MPKEHICQESILESGGSCTRNCVLLFCWCCALFGSCIIFATQNMFQTCFNMSWCAHCSKQISALLLAAGWQKCPNRAKQLALSDIVCWNNCSYFPGGNFNFWIRLGISRSKDNNCGLNFATSVQCGFCVQQLGPATQVITQCRKIARWSKNKKGPLKKQSI